MYIKSVLGLECIKLVEAALIFTQYNHPLKLHNFFDSRDETIPDHVTLHKGHALIIFEKEKMQCFVGKGLFILALLHVSAGQKLNTLWPVPQEYMVQPIGDAVKLSSGFAIVANQSSQILSRAIQRYTSFIMQRDDEREYLQTCSNSTISISKLNIMVASQDETLNISTSYEYTLTVDSGEASISATTIYGAM